MRSRYLTCLALCITAACASEGSDAANPQGPRDALAVGPEWPDPPRADPPAPPQNAPRAGTALTPSNLPADICDTPGLADLDVPAQTSSTLDQSACDAVVSQGEGLPSICLRKFANVNIAGSLQIAPNAAQNAAVAIVATGTFVLAGGVQAVNDVGTSDPRADATGCSLGGQQVSTSGTSLVPGGLGGEGCAGRESSGGLRGLAGGAVQIVACGELTLSGPVIVSGANGSGGQGSIGSNNPAGSGGGGGSGGTVLIEALRIVTFDGAGAFSVGGHGGGGGSAQRLGDPGVPGQIYPGGAGGLGGTGSRSPTAGEWTPQEPWLPGAGGSGGAIGRIRMNLPAGVPFPAWVTDPPASHGVVGTH